MQRQEDETKALPHPNPKPALDQPASAGLMAPLRTVQRWFSLYSANPSPNPPVRTWRLPERSGTNLIEKNKSLAKHRAHGATLAHYLAHDPTLPPIRWLQFAAKLARFAEETKFSSRLNLQTLRYEEATENLFLLNHQPEPLITKEFTRLLAEVLGFTLQDAQLLITTKTLNRLAPRNITETLQQFLQENLCCNRPFEERIGDFLNVFDECALRCSDLVGAVRRIALLNLDDYTRPLQRIMLDALHSALQAADQVMLIDLNQQYQARYAEIAEKLQAAQIKFSHKIIFTKNAKTSLETLLTRLTQLKQLPDDTPAYYFFVTTQFYSEQWTNSLKRYGLTTLFVDPLFRKNDYEIHMRDEIWIRRNGFFLNCQIRYVLNELRTEVRWLQNTYLNKPSPFLIRETAHANVDTLNFMINQLDNASMVKKMTLEEIMEIIAPLTPIILNRMNNIMQVLAEQRPNARYQLQRLAP